MRITVVSVAGKLPAWVESGVADYSRRLPRELRLEWCDLPLARRGRDTPAEQLRQREGEQILRRLPADDRVIALDVVGQPWSTADLGDRLRGWMMDGRNVSLVIGGPDGLSPECLAAAEQRWSLGPLTLPHPLVRVVLAEQLYRAWTITVNHPYHRA